MAILIGIVLVVTGITAALLLHGHRKAALAFGGLVLLAVLTWAVVSVIFVIFITKEIP